MGRPLLPLPPTEEQEPAVAGWVAGLLQQAQALQPGVTRALAEQQQLPRHRLVPQSKPVEQDSPGELSRQEPEFTRQALQPMRAAEALQQKPSLQAEEEH